MLAARALRAFGDGYVAVLLPVRLSRHGYGPLAVGAMADRGEFASEAEMESFFRAP